MTGKDTDLLRTGIEKLGLPADDDKIREIEVYLDELTMWNNRFNLVGYDSPRQLIIRHLLDSLSGVRVIKQLEAGLPKKTIADVGSGAGFPGIPLALYLPRFQIDLIERSSKRAGFLRNIRALLKLFHVRIVNKSATETASAYSLVTTRALGDITAAFGELAGITEKGGGILLYKGKSAMIHDELHAIKRKISRYKVYPVTVPFLEAERNLVYIEVD